MKTKLYLEAGHPGYSLMHVKLWMVLYKNLGVLSLSFPFINMGPI